MNENQDGALESQQTNIETVDSTNNDTTTTTTNELVNSQNTPGFSENSARSTEAHVQSQNNFNEAGDNEQPGSSGKSPTRRKQKGKSRKRRRSHSVSESSSEDESSDTHSSCSGSNSSDEGSSNESEGDQEDEQTPTKIPRFRAKSSEVKNKWKLPSDMAKYVNKHLSKYIPEKDIQDSILEESPVPSNVRQNIPLDDFLKEIMVDENKYKESAFEANMSKVQGKIIKSLGPLSKVWQVLEKAKTCTEDKKAVPKLT